MKADRKSEMERTIEIPQQKKWRMIKGKEDGMTNRGGVTYEKKKRFKWVTGPKDMARAKYNSTLMTNTDDSFMTKNTNSKLIIKYQYKADVFAKYRW